MKFTTTSYYVATLCLLLVVSQTPVAHAHLRRGTKGWRESASSNSRNNNVNQAETHRSLKKKGRESTPLQTTQIGEATDREDAVEEVNEDTIFGFNEMGDTMFVDVEDEPEETEENFQFDDPEAWQRIEDSFVPGSPIDVESSVNNSFIPPSSPIDDEEEMGEEGEVIEEPSVITMEDRSQDSIMNATDLDDPSLALDIALAGFDDPMLLGQEEDPSYLVVDEDPSPQAAESTLQQLEARIFEVEIQMDTLTTMTESISTLELELQKALQIIAIHEKAISTLAATLHAREAPSHITGLNEEESDP